MPAQPHKRQPHKRQPGHADDRQLSRQQFAVLIGGLLATAVGQSFIFAILPPLGRDVGFNEIQINSLISTSALVFSLSSPWWGRLSDRIGRKPVILIGLAGYALGNLVFALILDAGLRGWLTGVPLFVTALVLRCCQSSIMAATPPGAGAYAADHSGPRQRTRTLVRLGTANSMGMIVGPVLAGGLAGVGLMFPLYTATLLAGLAVLIVYRQLPADMASPGGPRPSVKLRFWDPRIRLFLGSAFGAFTGFSGIQQTLGFRLQDLLTLTGTQTAQHTGLCLMAAALCTFAMQISIAQRFKGAPIILIRYGLGALAAGSLVVASASDFATFLCAMALMGAGLGLVMPAVAAAASLAVSPEEQGGAAGFVSACSAAGFVAGPVVCGGLYTLDATASALSTTVVLIAVLVASLLSR